MYFNLVSFLFLLIERFISMPINTSSVIDFHIVHPSFSMLLVIGMLFPLVKISKVEKIKKPANPYVYDALPQ